MSHYKAYPKYKNSGVEWIGDVPDGWDVARIKRFTSLRNERCTDAPEGWRYIGLEDVESGSGKYRPTEGNSRQNEDSTVGVFKSGDVLYGKLRPYLKKAIVSDSNGVCSTEFLVMQPTLIMAPWLQQWLLTTEVTQQIEAGCEGTKMPRADWEHVGSIYVPSPSQSEQAKIIAALDRENARIDAIIAKKTRFIELLKEKRSALITHAVTKGINLNVKMKDSGVEWIDEVPEGWEVKRLRHISEFKNSSVDKKTYEGQAAVGLCNYTDVYYNEFITKDLSFMQATASPAEIEQFSLQKGDVIITKDSEDPSDIGIPALVADDVPGVVCGYHLTQIRTGDLNTARLIHRTMQSHVTLAYFFVEAPGITRYGLGQDTIGSVTICLPPLNHRGSIADWIDHETARLDLLALKTKLSIDLLKERRSAMITAAVTGQIDLRETA